MFPRNVQTCSQQSLVKFDFSAIEQYIYLTLTVILVEHTCKYCLTAKYLSDLGGTNLEEELCVDTKDSCQLQFIYIETKDTVTRYLSDNA